MTDWERLLAAMATIQAPEWREERKVQEHVPTRVEEPHGLGSEKN